MKQSLAIIPKPRKTTIQNGTLQLTSTASISCSEGGEAAANLIQKLTGYPLKNAEGEIRFEFTPHIQGNEAYCIDVDQSGIQITAATPAGLFYGAQTLRQLLPAEIEQRTVHSPIEIPFLQIEDAPRFVHRGFMLDVARYFFDVEEIKRIIDLLAMQKFNRFHLHLTDDQGWRIEIKKYPRLTEIGSKRKESQAGGWLLSKPVYDGIPHSGFYTQDDIRTIVAYAKENFIEVIPEIDVPGHAAAAMAAYPELSCSGEPMEVRKSIGTFSKPMCVGKDFTFEFLNDVIMEIADLFPYRHIHIGGDEVGKREWKKCPHCQARMTKEGLKSVRDLQVYFENRLASIVSSKECHAISWSEALHDNLDKKVINQFWLFTNKKKTISELKKGRKIIISDFSSLYLDYSYQVMALKKTYTFEPQFSEINDDQAGNILGVEGALWSEYVDSRDRIDWQMFPRILAISETAWSSKNQRDFHDFLKRLSHIEKRLDALNVNYTHPECYLKYGEISRIPHVLKILFTREHPGLKEYKQYPQH